MSLQRLLKLPVLRESLAAGTTNLYDQIKDELITPPIKLGRTSCWPEYEIAQIQKAVISGKSLDERRQLVRQLVAERSGGNNSKSPAQRTREQIEGDQPTPPQTAATASHRRKKKPKRIGTSKIGARRVR